MKIIILKGIPASGKSTWSKDFVKNNLDYIRTNKDEIRIELGSKEKPCRNENRVIARRDELIYEALNNGKSVIVDDTNLNPIHEKRIKQIAFEMQQKLGNPIDVEIKLFEIPLDEAIKRDSKREAGVGEATIRRMYKQFYDNNQ